MFDGIKPGDIVTRMLAGVVPMQLEVSEVTDTQIICGDWKFSRLSGVEIDEELGWDSDHSGSYLKAEFTSQPPPQQKEADRGTGAGKERRP